MTMNFSHILLPCTLFVPSFEGHKKHVIGIVVKLLVLNRNKKIKFQFRGWYSNHKSTTNPCTHDIYWPFQIQKRAVSKVTPGWRHAFRGDFGHVKQVPKMFITTHRQGRFKPHFISCSQSKRVKSIQWCFCTVSVSASISKHVCAFVMLMFPFLSTFQIFLNALMGHIPWCFVFKLLYWGISWGNQEPF